MTAGRRYRALLLGNSEFPREPVQLPGLAGPPADVERLREALTDREYGLHRAEDVIVRRDLEISPMREEIEVFLDAGRPGDQLLVFYSGHGWREEDGELYLCARDTTRRAIRSTTLSAADLAGQMQASRASATIVVLDCCNSGNYRFKGPSPVRVFDGSGVAALTSSQPDRPSRDAVAPGRTSQFTGHLVAGLRGAARGRDGHLLLSDLYEYVHERMAAEGAIRPTYHNRLAGLVALGRTPRAGGSAAGSNLAADQLKAALRLESVDRVSALRALRRLSELDNGWGTLAALRLGELATADGDDATAVRAYDRVLASGDPRWAAEAAYRRGIRLAAMGEPDHAGESWRRAVELDDPRWSPAAARELGRRLCGDPATVTAGIAHYRQALVALDDPGLALEAGDAMRAAGLYDEARAIYRRLVSRAGRPWSVIGADRQAGLPAPGAGRS